MRHIGGHVSIAGGLPNAITNTLKIQGNCLQIFAGSPRLWLRKPFPKTEVDTFLKGIKDNHLGPVFIHALYLVNLATDNQELLEKSITSLVADLNNGQLINSRGVIVHIGSHQGRGFDSVKNQITEVIREILNKTDEIALILENDAGQNGKIGSLEELAYIKDSIKDDRIKICLDTAHLFESGYDLRDQDSLDRLVKSLKDMNLLKDVVCLHLNDSATDLNSHRDMHANIGEGLIGIDGLKKVVNHPDFSTLPLLLEVPGENKTGPNLENVKRTASLIS